MHVVKVLLWREYHQKQRQHSPFFYKALNTFIINDEHNRFKFIVQLKMASTIMLMYFMS